MACGVALVKGHSPERSGAALVECGHGVRVARGTPTTGVGAGAQVTGGKPIEAAALPYAGRSRGVGVESHASAEKALGNVAQKSDVLMFAAYSAAFLWAG